MVEDATDGCTCLDCETERKLNDRESLVFCVKHNEPECIFCADLEHWTDE